MSDIRERDLLGGTIELPPPPNDMLEVDQYQDKSDHNSGATSEHGGNSSCSAATTVGDGNSGSGNDGSIDSDSQTNHPYSPSIAADQSAQDLQIEKKRRHVKVACERCNRCHLGCDHQRPCRNCVRHGVQCVDTKERKKRGRKRKVPLNPFVDEGAAAVPTDLSIRHGHEQRPMYIPGNTHAPAESLPQRRNFYPRTNGDRPHRVREMPPQGEKPPFEGANVIRRSPMATSAPPPQDTPPWDLPPFPPHEPLPSGSRYSVRRSNMFGQRRTPQMLLRSPGLSPAGRISPTILEECMTLQPSALPLQWHPPILDPETLYAAAGSVLKEYPHPKHPAYDQHIAMRPEHNHVIGPFVSSHLS